MNLENRTASSEHYPLQERTSMPTPAAECEKYSACFDCNICLEFVHDPVLTFCGHLFCWPCIYKWFDRQHAALGSGKLPQCPVCKDEISEKFVVPLYGRGRSLPQSEPKSKVIPPRPQARVIKDFAGLFSTEKQLASHYPSHNQQLVDRRVYPAGDLSPSLVSFRGISAGMLWQKIKGNMREAATDWQRFLWVVTCVIGVTCGFILSCGIYMTG